MANMQGKCPHCEGSLYLEDGCRKCFNCSREIRTIPDRKAFYEHNRVAILNCLDQIGRVQTYKKWGIPSATIFGLLRRWGVLKEKTPQATSLAPEGNHLPRLPEFSSDWTPEVQIKWLEVWAVGK